MVEYKTGLHDDALITKPGFFFSSVASLNDLLSVFLSLAGGKILRETCSGSAL